MSSGTGTDADRPPEPPAPATGETDEILHRQGRPRTGLYAVVALLVVVVLIAGTVLAGYAGYGPFNTVFHPSSVCTGLPATTLNGAGSTLVAPLMYTWGTAYPQSTINYAAVGSSAGINDITGETVQFGASDAPLNPTQRSAIPSPGVYTIPESIGAAVPIYNLPGVSQTLRFNGSVLAEIYLGTISNWNNSALQSLNPGVTLPNATLTPVFRSDGSGTTFIWTSFLWASSAAWRAHFGSKAVGASTAINFPVGTGQKGNAGVTQTVKGNPYFLGYVDINYALTQSIAYGSVQNPSGNFILANLTNIASAVADSNPTFPAAVPNADWYNLSVENAPGAHDYPISSFTYLFVYSDLKSAYGSSFTKDDAENLVSFLWWVVTKGQSYSAPLYYVPLSSSAVAFDEGEIKSITYGGGSLSICQVA